MSTIQIQLLLIAPTTTTTTITTTFLLFIKQTLKSRLAEMLKINIQQK